MIAFTYELYYQKHHLTYQIISYHSSISEKHRIIKSVDTLMALCDSFKAWLKKQVEIETKITDAVVKSIQTG